MAVGTLDKVEVKGPGVEEVKMLTGCSRLIKWRDTMSMAWNTEYC